MPTPGAFDAPGHVMSLARRTPRWARQQIVRGLVAAFRGVNAENETPEDVGARQKPGRNPTVTIIGPVTEHVAALPRRARGGFLQERNVA